MPGLKYAKPRARLLDKREKAAAIAAIDRAERAKCKARSGGQCEVLVTLDYGTFGATITKKLTRRCPRRASQNHHLIGGSGRRNTGKSILAAHRLDVCDKCHIEITGNVLQPIDGAKREDAATIVYERVR